MLGRQRRSLFPILVVSMLSLRSPGFAADAVYQLHDQVQTAVDVKGLHHPSAIAFVQHPGPGPKDPLYFVTELHGDIKVVTNDRSVVAFSKAFAKINLSRNLPAMAAEIGVTGICLEETHGYVFVTYSYHDNGTLRNGITRFETVPFRFASKPRDRRSFDSIFAKDKASPAHQIGTCQVIGAELFVGVGDAYKPHKAKNIDVTLGKILRMNLDGEPLETNPFYEPPHRQTRNYVWASGLRNPYSLLAIDDELFAAENGAGTDRFFKVEKGRDYLWRGRPDSLKLNATVLFSPSVGPVQLAFIDSSAKFLPKNFRQSVVMTTYGAMRENAAKVPTILWFNYDPANDFAMSNPAEILSYSGKPIQGFTALAVGPDALYFSYMFGSKSDGSSIVKIYKKSRSARLAQGQGAEGARLLRTRGCLICHGGLEEQQQAISFRSKNFLRTPARRIFSKDYAKGLAKIDELDQEPFRSHRGSRRAVIEAEGIERLRAWVKFHIIEPRFDDPNAQMPNLDIGQEEAAILSRFLVDMFLSARRDDKQIRPGDR